MEEGLRPGYKAQETIDRSTHSVGADAGARVEPLRERRVAVADVAGAGFNLFVHIDLSLRRTVRFCLYHARPPSSSAGVLHHLINVLVEPTQGMHDFGSGLRAGQLPRELQEHRADLLTRCLRPLRPPR